MATPPEFYIDEGLAGKSLRRFFQDLGYIVHTPAEVFGSRHAAEGTPDVLWLTCCGWAGWVAVAKDTKILQRPDELAALVRAKIHIVYYRGDATRDELLALAAATLREVCAVTSLAGGGVWRVRGGAHPHLEHVDV